MEMSRVKITIRKIILHGFGRPNTYNLLVLIMVRYIYVCNVDVEKKLNNKKQHMYLTFQYDLFKPSKDPSE